MTDVLSGGSGVMNNFTFDVPTVIHFGRGQISHLAELGAAGRSVLMVYGGGSIKKNGIYDSAVKVLSDAGLAVYELPGVEPNPKIGLVREGVSMCRAYGIDMVLAIGGGSSIDCAKLVAAGARYDGDPWDLMVDSSLINAALPVYVVLTLAATGSEMDNSTVVSNLETNQKLDIANNLLKPRMAVLDPEYTYTVPRKQTAAGSVDIMSHVFESYFTNTAGADIQGEMCLAILKVVVKYAPAAMEDPGNYDARANLMWCSSLALNGLLTLGAKVKWCVHPIEHELSAYYDITHGVGLAILTPVWMEYILSDDTAPKLAEYGKVVWNISDGCSDMDAARLAIRRTRDFFDRLGMPKSLGELGIDDTHFEAMADSAYGFCKGCYVPLSREDIVQIYRNAL